MIVAAAGGMFVLGTAILVVFLGCCFAMVIDVRRYAREVDLDALWDDYAIDETVFADTLADVRSLPEVVA